jgi:hypothetical protein
MLAWTARRAFNTAYYWIVRYMEKEERKAFDDSIRMTRADWITQATEAAIYEEMQRQQRIRQIAEVG